MSNFQTDLQRGKDGEAEFQAAFGEWLRPTDGREGDFIIKATGEKLEVKTDSYCPVKYKNFIMERFRSGSKNGGPWQALDHGCKYFAYRFKKTGDTYLFDTSALVAKLESMEHTPFTIGNDTYETTYYKVPRNALESLYLDISTTLAPVTVVAPPVIEVCHKQILLNSDNAAYHGNRTHLSSSNIKMLLKAPEQFYTEWILGQKPPEKENPNFSEGSFVHSLILEPESMSQYAIFPGLRKAGNAFEAFEAANPNKTILSAAQVKRCEDLYKAYAKMPVATVMLRNGFAEHTMLANILDVPIKTRADFINIDAGYIVDVKTTAAPTDIDVFRATVVQYSYELSAALYCEAARENYGKLFDFYWLVLSKQDGGCAIYKASSDTLSFGTAMYTQGLVMYKKCLASGVWSVNQPAESFSSNFEILEV